MSSSSFASIGWPAVSHLLAVIEDLEERGVHFRSIRDPIDTSKPQGMFSLQVLGAVAQLERALIAERTKAGIEAAKARGKLPGNPGLRERPPEAIKSVSKARAKRYLDELIASAQTWLPDGAATAASPQLGQRRAGA
jgi:DNA invertase Pin-like site-specific DNA recombinase